MVRSHRESRRRRTTLSAPAVDSDASGTANGDTPTATITFAIAEDAPAADAVVQFEDAETELLEFPLPVLTSRELVVGVDDGGERVAPLDGAEDGGDGDGPGVTLAEESAETAAGASRIDTDVAVVGAVFAGLVALAVRLRQR